jgi:hypothetical protein
MAATSLVVRWSIDHRIQLQMDSWTDTMAEALSCSSGRSPSSAGTAWVDPFLSLSLSRESRSLARPRDDEE